MTTIIRMNTNQVMELNYALMELVQTLSMHGSDLAKSVAILDNNMSGEGVDVYINNLKKWLVQYVAIGQDMQNLGQKLSRELLEWQLVDAQKPFGTGYDGSISISIGGGIILEGGSSEIERSMLEKALGWVPSDTLHTGLDIYHRGREDWVKYQDKDEALLAIGMDAYHEYQKAVTKAIIIETVTTSVTTTLLATPAAPVAVPVGLLAGFISGYAYEWVSDEAWDWLDDSGIKDTIVHAGGEVIDWGKEGIMSGVEGVIDFGSGAGGLIKKGWNKIF